LQRISYAVHVPEINGDAAVIEYDEVNVGYNALTKVMVLVAVA